MIPYGRHDLSDEDIQAVVKVLRSDSLTQGPVVPEFERSISEICGSDFAVAMNSATSTLHAACVALGLGPDDLMWTSPITFVASANSALYCGANVDFVDIDPKSYNISIAALTEKLRLADKEGSLPKVVMPVHLCGQSCEMEAIFNLSKKYGFRIIEDASHAIGGHYQSKPIFGRGFSDIAVFSFHPVKILTSGEGGLAVTNCPELNEKLLAFRSHGITRDSTKMSGLREDEIWNYQQVQLGFNYRMTDIHGALGLSQVKRLDEFIQVRRNIADRYNQAFRQTPVVTPWQHPDSQSSFHLYPIRVRSDKCGISRNDIYAHCRAQNIGVNIHYAPVYRHPYFRKNFGFCEGYCPEAEAYFRETISLPIFPKLSPDDQSFVIDKVLERVR